MPNRLGLHLQTPAGNRQEAGRRQDGGKGGEHAAAGTRPPTADVAFTDICCTERVRRRQSYRVYAGSTIERAVTNRPKTTTAAETRVLQGDDSKYDENDNYDEYDSKNSHGSMLLSMRVLMKMFFFFALSIRYIVVTHRRYPTLLE